MEQTRGESRGRVIPLLSTNGHAKPHVVGPVMASSRKDLPSNLESRLQQAWLNSQAQKGTAGRIVIAAGEAGEGSMQQLNSRGPAAGTVKDAEGGSSSRGKRVRSPDRFRSSSNLSASLQQLYKRTSTTVAVEKDAAFAAFSFPPFEASKGSSPPAAAIPLLLPFNSSTKSYSSSSSSNRSGEQSRAAATETVEDEFMRIMQQLINNDAASKQTDMDAELDSMADGHGQEAQSAASQCPPPPPQIAASAAALKAAGPAPDSASPLQAAHPAAAASAANGLLGSASLQLDGSSLQDMGGEEFLRGLDELNCAFGELDDLFVSDLPHSPSQLGPAEDLEQDRASVGTASAFDLLNSLLRMDQEEDSAQSNPVLSHEGSGSSRQLALNGAGPAEESNESGGREVDEEEQQASAALSKLHDECQKKKGAEYESEVSQSEQTAEAEREEAAGGSSGEGRREDFTAWAERRNDPIALLVKIAQAIVAGKQNEVHELMTRLNQVASVYGDVSQRISSYFLEGLIARMAGTPPKPHRTDLVEPFLDETRCGDVEAKERQRMQRQQQQQKEQGQGHECSDECREACARGKGEEAKTKAADQEAFSSCNFGLMESFQVLVNASPFLTFGQVAANSAILEALADETHVHIIDFGIGHALQWPALLQALAARPGGAPHIKLTGIEIPQEGSRRAYCVYKAGARLTMTARMWGVPFEYHTVQSRLEDVTLDMLKLASGETVVVNCALRLSQLLDESVIQSNPRSAVLRTIHALRPKICTIVEQYSNHNSPFFLARFYEALFFYTSLFESMDAALDRNEVARRFFEEKVLGRQIVNVVACEGKDRVERQEPLERWQQRMQSAGFQSKPLSDSVVTTVKALLQSYKKPGHDVVREGEGGLVLLWKEKPLLAMSSWEPKL